MCPSSRRGLLRSRLVAPLAVLAVAAAAPVVLPTPARAADAGEAGAKVTLHPGDPAPKLYVSKWVKGGPVDELKKGNVYVIECWASWCGPCRASIPHVTELQKKYKDKGLTVIGLDVLDKPAPAEEMVQQFGDKMNYVVALDEPAEKGEAGDAGKSAKAWLEAAGQNGIPCSFIVDRAGKVAWVGHPMTMERPLALVLDDKFDPAKEQEFQKKQEELDQQQNEAMKAKDYDKVLSIIEQLAAMDPYMADYQELEKLPILIRKGDYDAANKLAGKLGDQFKDNAMLLPQVASLMLQPPADPSKIDAPLALKLAQQAYDESQGKGLRETRLLGQALAANKQYGKAAELQAKVVEQLKGPIKAQEQKLLDEYRAKAGIKPDGSANPPAETKEQK